MWVLNINRKEAPMMPAPYNADLRWRVIWFATLSRGQLAVRRRKRERHLKMSLRVSAIFQLFKVIMPEKCALTILDLNRNQRLNICHHMLTSSTQLQKRSFHVIERTRTSSKCQKMKNARAKRAKILFSIVK